LAGDSDIVFLGRTPECVFDLTSGVLANTSWRDRMVLLYLSLRWSAPPDRHQEEAIRPYLAELGLHPRTVERRPRPIAFVDYVASGDTFGTFLGVLQSWCADEGAPWRPVAERIKIVGLTMRDKASPKTRRWQQHADWVALLRPASIKNVSLPGELGPYLASGVPKATVPFPPERWADPTVRRPQHDEEARRGLEFARHLFVLGQRSDTRRRFAAELLRRPAARESWLRSLALEIRR
jgi:hypothetical protein